MKPLFKKKIRNVCMYVQRESTMQYVWEYSEAYTAFTPQTKMHIKLKTFLYMIRPPPHPPPQTHFIWGCTDFRWNKTASPTEGSLVNSFSVAFQENMRNISCSRQLRAKHVWTAFLITLYKSNLELALPTIIFLIYKPKILEANFLACLRVTTIPVCLKCVFATA